MVSFCDASAWQELKIAAAEIKAVANSILASVLLVVVCVCVLASSSLEANERKELLNDRSRRLYHRGFPHLRRRVTSFTYASGGVYCTRRVFT
jgi:hypothetical protein